MGIRKFSIDSLKRDKESTLTYIVSLGISFMLVFTVFNLAYLESVLEEQGIILALVIFTVLFISFYIGYYMNNFFVDRRAKEVSVALVSGSSLGHLTESFLIQNIISSGFAMVIGFIGFLVIKPIISLLGKIYLSNFNLDFSLEGTSIAFILILMEIIFITLSNIGISYRSEICDLIQHNEKNTIKKRSAVKQFVGIISAFGTVIPLVGVYYAIYGDKESYSVIAVILLLCGFLAEGTLATIAIPTFIDNFAKTLKNRKNKIIILRNLKDSLEGSKGIIISYLAIFITFMMSTNFLSDSKEFILRSTIITILSAVLLVIIFIYKFYVDGTRKRVYFERMNLLGYEKEDLLKVIKGETLIYFLIVFLIPMIQLSVITIGYVTLGILDLSICLTVVLSTLVVMTLGAIISYMVYKAVVLKNLIVKKDN